MVYRYCVIVTMTVVAMCSNTRSHSQSIDEIYTPLSIARYYIDAHTKQDFATMSRFMAPDAVYVDATAPEEVGGPILWSGRQSVLDRMAQFKTDTRLISLERTPERVFESNGVVVFQGPATALFSGPDGQPFRWAAEVVTVITVRNDQVVRHEDFADYNGAEQGPAG